MPVPLHVVKEVLVLGGLLNGGRVVVVPPLPFLVQIRNLLEPLPQRRKLAVHTGLRDLVDDVGDGNGTKCNPEAGLCEPVSPPSRVNTTNGQADCSAAGAQAGHEESLACLLPVIPKPHGPRGGGRVRDLRRMILCCACQAAGLAGACTLHAVGGRTSWRLPCAVVNRSRLEPRTQSRVGGVLGFLAQDPASFRLAVFYSK